MSKLCYFQWKEPREVRQWSRKILIDRLKSEWFFDFSFLIIVAFVAWMSWRWLVNGIAAFNDIGVVTGSLLLLTILACVPKTYLISPKGLRVETGMSRDWYRWDEIEYYEVKESPFIAPNIACLSFKAQRKKDLSWPQFYFDTNEIDEAKLRGVLQQHLPDKEMTPAKMLFA